VLVTGTNLVTLLDFVLGADGDPAENDAGTEAAHRVATHAAERGRAALVAHPLVAPARPATPPAPASPDSARGVEVGSAD
jgi:hypothetical protein